LSFYLFAFSLLIDTDEDAMKQNKPNQLLVVINDCHQLLAWIVPQLDHFPRNRRFTLGEKLEMLLLEVLEYLLEAVYQKGDYKLQLLIRTNRELVVARHLWRLGFELKSCSFKAYNHGAGLMTGFGRQIGGWCKNLSVGAIHG
jgi:hypothetical protein